MKEERGSLRKRGGDPRTRFQKPIPTLLSTLSSFFGIHPRKEGRGKERSEKGDFMGHHELTRGEKKMKLYYPPTVFPRIFKLFFILLYMEEHGAELFGQICKKAPPHSADMGTDGRTTALQFGNFFSLGLCLRTPAGSYIPSSLCESPT